MNIGSVYPDMKEFRLAIRQFAIHEEFELHIEKTDPSRVIGNCMVEDCPCHIVGRRQPDQKVGMLLTSYLTMAYAFVQNKFYWQLTVCFHLQVTILMNKHTCMSSSRKRTTTPTCAWVASKAVRILRKKAMGTKELMDKLEDQFRCTIVYDIVWRGRQKAMTEVYGNWEDSFQLLFRWKEEVFKWSPGNIVEIETKVIDDQVTFHRFCALSPCIEGFKE
jgi:hypothetical protein